MSVNCYSNPPIGGAAVVGGGTGAPLLQGLKGDSGQNNGGITLLSYPAGQALSSGRAVVKENDGKIYYFNPSNTDHVGRLIGITTIAAVSNQAVTIQSMEIIEDSGFSFNPNERVYAGLNGVLSNNQVSSGLVQYVGISLTATRLQINIQLPLIKI